MIHLPTGQITEDVLQSLVANGIYEERQLEFKRALPGTSDEEIKEFLKDVSAMANSAGGDILYGIAEGPDSNGNTAALDVAGVSGADADKVKLRVESLIRDCIKPRIIGIEIKDVRLSNSNTVFIIRVPQSWISPHVVDRKGHWRFYYRDSAGAHPMDVSELRHAMTLSDTLAQRLEEFRLDRIAKIAGDDALASSAKIILHLQPFSSIQPNAQVDIRMAQRDHDTITLLKLIASESFPTTRPNFDGLLSFLPDQQGRGWLQIFRNGVLEAVDTGVLMPLSNGRRTIHASHFETALLEATTNYLKLIKKLGAAPPLMLTLTMLGVRGYTMLISTDDLVSRDFMVISRLTRRAEQTPIDRDDLFLRGTIIEDPGADVGELLHPSIDAIWNAAGFDGSLFYNAKGRRTSQIASR